MARMVYYLSLGLAYLRQIVTTSACDHHCQPLIARKEGPGCSVFNALMARGYSEGLPELGGYTEEDRHAHIPAEIATDSKKGPKRA